MKAKPTSLKRICKLLDDEKVLYMRAAVTAKDTQTGEGVETVVIMMGAVFNKETGAYMLAAPIANPLPRNGTEGEYGLLDSKT